MEASANATLTSSIWTATKLGNVNIPPQIDSVIEAVTNASSWTITLTVLAILVAYDQRTSRQIASVPFFFFFFLLHSRSLVSLGPWL